MNGNTVTLSAISQNGIVLEEENQFVRFLNINRRNLENLVGYEIFKE
ncbi:hypothetical protein AB9P05_21830 [Roseivirga sp. BDSF3-8]